MLLCHSHNNLLEYNSNLRFLNIVIQYSSNLDIESNGSSGHDDDERLSGEEREDQPSNRLTKDCSHHSQLTS